MKLFFKVIILFLIVFNFRIPNIYNSVFLSIILTTLYYVFIRKSIPFVYFTQRHNITIIIATILLCLIYTAYTVFHEQFYFDYVKRLIIQFSMLIALIYALPLLIEEGQELEAFNVASQIICYAFALQGLIHLIGFLNNDFGDYILSLQPQDVQDRVFDPGRNIKVYRAYALTGSAFFELPCAYGVAAILFMRLKLIEDGYRYFPKHIDYIIFALILAGIMLSGRIGFIGIILSGFLYFIFVSDPIVILNRIFRRSIVFVPVFLFFYFFIFSESQRVSFEEELFPFAFEFYYNFRDTGKLRTVSSDATIEAFYFPLKENTLVWGHGTGSRELLDIYNFTDAGYMRTLMYGGIPLLLILIFYQYLYFHIPMSIAREDKTRENNVNFYCFLLLFLYMLMVHYKDNALGLQHITETLFLFAGSTCFIQYGENRNLE